MKYLNKIIYYNSNMYKIRKISTYHFYINTNKTDINTENYEYANILPQFEKETLRHWVKT